MSQLLEKSILIRAVLGVGILCGFAAWWCLQPDTSSEWLRTLSIAVALAVPTTIFLGSSPVWTWVWKIVPPLNRWVFPNLNGDWEVTMKSNIGKIAEFHPGMKGTKVPKNIKGKVTIKQNWFRTVMIFHGNNNYSNSETSFVKLERTKNSGRFILAYVYQNKTPKPKDSDEQMHHGAGEVEVRWIDGEPKIAGLYWTNRNWPQGLNTAGEVTMVRTSK